MCARDGAECPNLAHRVIGGAHDSRYPLKADSSVTAMKLSSLHGNADPTFSRQRGANHFCNYVHSDRKARLSVTRDGRQVQPLLRTIIVGLRHRACMSASVMGH